MKTTLLSSIYLQNPVTFILIGLMLTVKTVERWFHKIKLQLLLHPFSIIRSRQYYRLITSDFIHHDWLHLAINGYFMYMFAGYLESYLNQCSQYGSLQFIIIYLISCLTGGIAVTISHKKDFGFTSGGASASIIGCLFSYIILQPKRIALFLPVIGPVTNFYFGMISILVLYIY